MPNPRIAVWVARARTSDGTRTTGWSARSKAQGWIESQIVVECEWRDDDTEDGRRVAEAAGEIVGSVQQVIIEDIVGLATKIPDQLASPEYIDPSDDNRDIIE